MPTAKISRIPPPRRHSKIPSDTGDDFGGDIVAVWSGDEVGDTCLPSDGVWVVVKMGVVPEPGNSVIVKTTLGIFSKAGLVVLLGVGERSV